MSINFEEPSTGNVNSEKTALVIKNIGNGGGISSESTIDGVIGKSTHSAGVRGESEDHPGVVGLTNSQVDYSHPKREKPSNSAIFGSSFNEGWGYGVAGSIIAKGGAAVYGISQNDEGNAIGVKGVSKKGVGVYGESDQYVGVQGKVNSNNNASGVFGVCYGDTTVNGVKGTSTGGVGVLGESQTFVAILGRGPIAGRFEGDVEVTGEIRVTKDIKLLNADFAEEFDIIEENVEAGTVMVLNDSGALLPCDQEYDKKVAGIVSGAGRYKPAIVLDSKESRDSNNRLPIALMGKVYCKVDARHSSIETGDLLTTSLTIGYAMKADDPMKAFGAVVGKALAPMKERIGMIPILVTLQ